MISEDLIDMLIDPDPTIRKQGVKILAKSKNPDALPYLAEVYRDDEDEEVRELARKAGIYIKKNAPSAGSMTTSDSLYADDGNDEDDIASDVNNTPLPSDIQVSKVNEERAKGLLQQALDLNMRGDNQRAIKALERALATDPRLGFDSYTVSFAATITGMPGQEAIQSLMPDDSKLEKMRHSGSSRKRRSGLHILLTYAVIIGAIMVLAGYLVLPWFAIGSIEVTEPTTGQIFTVSEVWDLLEESLDTIPDSPETNDLLDAYSGINFDANGLDTSFYATGITDLGALVGMDKLADYINRLGAGLLAGLISNEELAVLESTNDAQPVQYALFAVPAGAFLALLLSMLLLLRGGSTFLWSVTIVMGLLVVIPCAYYFTVGEEALRTGINWMLFMEIATPEQSLIGLGFWISLAGGMLILLVPFIAMLTEPAPQTDF